jgi:predicted transcriptional regulator
MEVQKMKEREDYRKEVAKFVGDCVRKKRVQMGLTVYALAKMAGLKPNQIDQIEKGLHCPRVDVLSRILNAMQDCLVIINRKLD